MPELPPVPERVSKRFPTITPEGWAHIQRTVDRLPPLTDAQRERLRLIFSGR